MSLFTGAAAAALTAFGGAGTKGVFDFLGAHQSANASKEAAALQARTAEEALQFTKQKQAQAEAQAAPYLSLGQQAVAKLPSIAQQAPAYGPPKPYTTQLGATAPMMGNFPTSLSGMSQPMLKGPSMTQMPTQDGGLVLLQAPDGSQKAVPAAQVSYYLARGATKVGG